MLKIIKEKRGGIVSGVIVSIFFFLIFLAIIFELILLAYAYVNADEVKCNLFWCTFKTTNTDIIQTIKCKFNNQTINFSGINESILNKFYKEYLK